MIGARIKELRQKKRLTRADFANAINVSERSIISYEQGTRNIPLELLPVIADYFGVSTDFLFDRTDELTPPKPKTMREILDEDPVTAGVTTLAANGAEQAVFTEAQKRGIQQLVKEALIRYDKEHANEKE